MNTNFRIISINEVMDSEKYYEVQHPTNAISLNADCLMAYKNFAAFVDINELSDTVKREIADLLDDVQEDVFVVNDNNQILAELVKDGSIEYWCPLIATKNRRETRIQSIAWNLPATFYLPSLQDYVA